MNRLILIATLLLMSASAAGERMAQQYNIDQVRQVEASHAVTVVIRQGETESLRVEAQADTLERVVVNQHGETLSLGVESQKGFWHWFGGSRDGEVRFILTLTELTGLKLEGASQARLSGLKTPELNLAFGSASRARLQSLETQRLKVDLWGASHLEINKLQSDTLNANVSGASGLVVKKGETMERLTLAVSGAGHYKAASVPVKRAEADASGGSRIELGATQKLDAQASGGSRIDYRGQPQGRKNASGGSRIQSR